MTNTAAETLTPAAIRDREYLSRITRRAIGPARRTVAAELAAVAALYEKHEGDGWRDFISPASDYPESEYDTVYPELTGYLAALRDAAGVSQGETETPERLRIAEPNGMGHSAAGDYVPTGYLLDAAGAVAGYYHLTRDYTGGGDYSLSRDYIGDRIAYAGTLAANPRDLTASICRRPSIYGRGTIGGDTAPRRYAAADTPRPSLTVWYVRRPDRNGVPDYDSRAFVCETCSALYARSIWQVDAETRDAADMAELQGDPFTCDRCGGVIAPD